MSDDSPISAATIFRSRPSHTTVPDLSPANLLVEQLANEMRRRWQQGEQPRAEELLDRHSELWQDPLAAIEVIYEEIHARQENGCNDPWPDMFERFPRWRQHLEALQECHQVLDPHSPSPRFPEVGDSLGEYRLVAELGRGLQGRVFLAKQPALADRPVVLKVTPRAGQEYLSLARLQHTNIVPLYTARDDRARQLRLLCMPYFGGATLFELLRQLAPEPMGRRSGRLLMDTVDLLQSTRPATVSNSSGPRALLMRATYAQAICWIGAGCADALQYAHERGLLHLDLKPSNLLIAADGQPMLLDFHLARAPIAPDGPLPDGLGGTPAYMAPEQLAASMVISNGAPLTVAVDARADVFGLGAVLYEALGGPIPFTTGAVTPLHRINPEVSIGLSDLVARCLEPSPGDRYPDAASLAADLRRHLTDRPLLGVANRSWPDRWRKWRRRRPGLFPAMVAMVLASAVVFALAMNTWVSMKGKIAEAEAALDEGNRQWRERAHFDEAESTLQRGLALLSFVPLRRDLTQQLQAELDRVGAAREGAMRHRLAQDLHLQTEQMRLLFGLDLQDSVRLRALLARCRELWSKRDLIKSALGPQNEANANVDLGDFAILWTDLSVRLATPAEVAGARREALRVLDEAREFLGASPVLARLQEQLRQALGLPGRTPPTHSSHPPQTAWEHYALGRSWLRSGDLKRAAAELNEAVILEPHECWPNYYYGLCAYRLQEFEDAALAFSVCIGSAPKLAGLYFNRALAYSGMERIELALRDYDRALQLDPTMAAAALNRGMLHFRNKRFAEAAHDLQAALELGSNPATIYYDLALVTLGQEDRAAATANLRRALEHNPSYPEAQSLLKQLETKRLKR